jgi:small subunit ribosomal protein S15
MPRKSVDAKPVIEKFARHETDTGSSEVQIAIMTQRINNLSEHLIKYKNDHKQKRTLLKLVGRRKKLLRYLHGTDLDKYKKVIDDLGIRGSF